MNKKEEITSFAHRRKVYGIGVNDANYMVNRKGYKQCKFYNVWCSMIERCYTERMHKKRPTYIGCYVCVDWLLFSNFRAWMAKQDWKGKELDKDLLIKGNKLYSPETCIFVSQEINKLIQNTKSVRGELPLGVSIDKRTGRFEARGHSFGKQKYIGMFDNSELASDAYKKFKYSVIAKIASNQKEPLKSALMTYKID